ncbi:MAG: hypothetical protein ACFCUI_01630 [Bernardetiaceae bacterium]
MKKKLTFAQQAKRFFLYAALILFIAGLGGGLFAYHANFSEGTRSGIVQKISKKGVVFKTHEGQMDIGGLRATADGKMTSVFDFSVEGNQRQLLDMLEEVSATGERVTIHYEEKFFKFPWRGDTKYLVVKVERLKKEIPKEKEKVEEPEQPEEEEPAEEVKPDPRDV